MDTPNSQAIRQRIGEVLIARGQINNDQLRIALHRQKNDNKPLGEELLDLHFITEQAMREAVSEAAGYKSIDLSGLVANAAALALIPKSIAIKHTLFPVSFDPEEADLVIVASNPDDILARDAIAPFLIQASQIAEKRIIPSWRIAPSAEVLATIDRFYNHELSIEGILFELESGELDMNALTQAGVSYSHPIVRLTDAILSDAVSRSASDIHFEPEEQFLRVRYRIDGVLRPVRSLAKSHWMAILVRLKVMSGMNIAETRAPQDGRISLAVWPPDRLSRRFTPDHTRRKFRVAYTRPQGRHRQPGQARHDRCATGPAQTHAGKTRRHTAGHRSYRFRQNHYPVFDTQPPESR